MFGLMNNYNPIGCLFIISSPSGAGKTSITNNLIAMLGQDNLKRSISLTTRPKRKGEINGCDYHFINETHYRQLQTSGAFIESAEVFGYKYATLKSEVESELSKGTSIVFNIDRQGAQQLASYSDNIVTLFILPPSIQELHNRLIKRNLDSKEKK